MPQSIHVLHYINQFFAGIGGEGLANTPVELRPGPVGPGRLLQEAIGAAASVKATIVCGDNFFNDERERASARVREILREVKPDPALSIEAQNDAVHNAPLVVSDRLAECTRGLEPPDLQVLDLEQKKPALPGVVYIWCLHSPQGMSNSLNTFCTATYGLTRLTPPWVLHPNEVVDGAINGTYRTSFATSWTVVNNPLFLEMYRRYGIDFNFPGVIAFRTEWTTQREKDLMTEQAAKTAELLGAQGAVVTWDAGGNEFIEVIHTVRACERRGIKTVFLTSEDSPEGGAPTLLEPCPEADAIVTSGFFSTSVMNLGLLPPVQRIIGNPVKVRGSMRDGAIPEAGAASTAAALPPPGRYDDHYGFGTLSSFAY